MTRWGRLKLYSSFIISSHSLLPIYQVWWGMQSQFLQSGLPGQVWSFLTACVECYKRIRRWQSHGDQIWHELHLYSCPLQTSWQHRVRVCQRCEQRTLWFILLQQCSAWCVTSSWREVHPRFQKEQIQDQNTAFSKNYNFVNIDWDVSWWKLPRNDFSLEVFENKDL